MSTETNIDEQSPAEAKPAPSQRNSITHVAERVQEAEPEMPPSEPEKKPGAKSHDDEASPPPPQPDAEGKKEERKPAADAEPEKPSPFPEHITNRYIQVGDKLYRSSTDKEPAFRDRGDSLTTRSPQAARDMVDVAKHRGWEKISVKGHKEFRREVWKAAMALGIECEGYKPTKVELEEALKSRESTIDKINPGADRAQAAQEQTASNPAAEKAGAAAPPKADFNQGVEGKVVKMGEERFDDKAKNPSPYVDLETADGRTQRAWGVALAEAVRDSGTKVGDTVLLKRMGTDPVAVTVTEKDPHTGRNQQTTVDAERNRWQLTTIERGKLEGPAKLAEKFLQQTHQENARDPELRSAQSHVMLAHSAAMKKFGTDYPEIEKATTAAKIAIAQKIERGESIQPVQVKEQARAQDQQTRDIHFPPPSRSRGR